ncbi:MAG: AraC family transcriptional regulator [Eubacteriales bacterium]|nr:AraC family transcriptional regulator [Eubacteriales bacterium]
MPEYKRLRAEQNVDMESGCLYRYVYGADDIFNPHSHEFYEIFITVSGGVTHWINGTKTELAEGTLVFIRQNDIHGYLYNSPENKKSEYVNLTFSVETAKELFDYLTDAFPSKELLNSAMPPSVILSEYDKKLLLSEIGELNSVNWKDKATLKIRVRVILANIFTRFFHSVSSIEDKGYPIWLSNLLAAMNRPENFTAGIERMSELSKKTREHLARTMKKHMGITPSEFINQKRINYASNLLLNTNKQILDICLICGFQSVSYFYKVFKEKYGISPKEFRKKYAISSQ